MAQPRTLMQMAGASGTPHPLAASAVVMFDVVGGFMTHMCVSSTVRAALDLGYGCTVVGNACATRDLLDCQGEVVSAAELHRAELAALGDRFAVVINVVADLSA
jgi:hypothetical protein